MATPVICLNDQGGQRMDVYTEAVGTLRSSMGGNVPMVLDSTKPNAEVPEHLSPTAMSSTGGCNAPLLFDNHRKDCRYDGPLEVAPTVTSFFGTGGGNVSLVSHATDVFLPDSICIAGNIIGREVENGGNGFGYQENLSYTLTATDQHAVFPQETYQTVVGSLCEGDKRGINNQYVSQSKCVVEAGENRKLIRRLTPLECERLQGFPDGWTEIEKCSDSARYKALGNSVAIPCVDFVLRGISFVLREMYLQGNPSTEEKVTEEKEGGT